MENLETQQQVIRLGKKIVDELGLEPGVDTLSRWMAHYIAEKIESIHSYEGAERDSARHECFELILNLWQHHAHYPNGNAPLTRFDAIYDAIERIDPEIETPYYRGLSKFYSQNQEVDKELESEAQNWINRALQLDSINREMINFCLQQAVIHESDDDTKQWLEAAAGLPGSNDANALMEILYRSVDNESKVSEDEEREREAAKLKKSIDRLYALDSFKDSLLEIYEAEYKVLIN